MDASVTAGWSDFFVAASGIAGALAGLAFVAVSINLARIIEMPAVSGRAAETILLLSGTLAGCLVALFPHLSARQLGTGLLLTTVPTWTLSMVVQIRSAWKRHYHTPGRALFRFINLQVATLPGIWSALALCGFLRGDITLFAISAILSMLVAILNAWVLLIEILR